LVKKMLINATKNWKKYLSIDDEIILNDLLTRAAKHRGAYRNADEIKVAQLWSALIENKKQMNALDERMKRIERLLGGLLERGREEEDRLLKSLRNF
jgi:hypothetical protein